MKYTITIALIILSLTMILSTCKDSPINPINQAQISLSLEDTSCTEAWIKLTTANISLPAEVILKQDDSTVQIISLSSSDSLLYFDSLLPNHTYEFQSIIQAINQSSNSLNVTTMDTTSHTFTNQSWEFGSQFGNCSLYDAAILNNNSIWSVGRIVLPDSQGLEELKNAVYWNGNEWIMKSIEVEFRGNNIVIPLTGVVAFSDSDIWVIGSLPIHGDGKNWTIYDLRSTLDPTISLSRGWGKSTNDIYFVGNLGSLVHYKNGKWQKLESGTSDRIADICGVSDKNGEWKIYYNTYNQLFKIDNSNKVIPIPTPTNTNLNSLWAANSHLLYTSGNGINLYRNDEWIKSEDISLSSIYLVKGFNYCDVFGLGSMGSIFHFNGYSWKKIYINLNNTYYYLNVNKNIAVAVGWEGEKAKVTRILRN